MYEDLGQLHVHNQHEHIKRYNFSCNVSIKTARSQQLLYFIITRFKHFPEKSDTCQSWRQHAEYCSHNWCGKKLSYYKCNIFVVLIPKPSSWTKKVGDSNFCCHKTSPEIVSCSFLINIPPLFSVSLYQSRRKRMCLVLIDHINTFMKPNLLKNG